MQKLSLCVIFGNEGNHIERFIRSFESVVDEFVFVRAIGARDPDNTWELIEKMRESTKPTIVLGEYKNKISDWQHVDRFCDARQLSFDLATGDLKMCVVFLRTGF